MQGGCGDARKLRWCREAVVVRGNCGGARRLWGCEEAAVVPGSCCGVRKLWWCDEAVVVRGGCGAARQTFLFGEPSRRCMHLSQQLFVKELFFGFKADILIGWPSCNSMQSC